MQQELFIDTEAEADLLSAIGFFEGLRPEPVLTVSEWADAHRRLSSKASAEPGPWNTDRTPYLREIMDKLSASDAAQEIIFMAAAQVGKTETGNNWIGYIIDNTPAPILMVMPTDETVKTNSNVRITPMIEETPRLRDKVGPARKRDGGNSVFQKDFPGGVLMLRGANSAVGLRSMPIRFLMLDEIDGYPADLDGEGSPIALAEARTRTFTRRKIYKVSTPTVSGLSAIETEFESTDKRYYYVPCTECGEFQQLLFENLVWEPGKPETAKYRCACCEALLPERVKSKMLKNGYWQATAPENASIIRFGYHISSLYSPWQTWAEIALMWERAQGNNEKLKTFINTVLGETWKAQGEAPDWQRLFNRREEYDAEKLVPADVAFVTCGVDVQRNRIEAEMVGWCRGNRSYSLGYFVLLGDTAEQAVWQQLAALIGRTWPRADGAELPVRMTAVDSGFNTMHVYDFVRQFPASRVAAVKGNEKLVVGVAAPRAVQTKLNGKRAGWSRLWGVGVSILKSELYGWLKLELAEGQPTPPGYCHFPTEYDSHFFKMLTAEQLQRARNKRGYSQDVWIKKFDRNEALDCRVYARAAALMIGVERWTPRQWAAATPASEPAPYGAPLVAVAPPPTVSSPPAPAAPARPASTPAPKPRGAFLGRHSNFKIR